MSYRVVAFFVFQKEIEQICSVKKSIRTEEFKFLRKKLIGLDYQKRR